MSQINEGYEITEHINIGSKHYVLGHNPAGPAAYATWQSNQAQTRFHSGNYFSNYDDALTNLLLRAIKDYQEIQDSFAVSLLTDSDRERIYTEIRESRKETELHAIMAKAMAQTGYSLDLTALFQDTEFMAQLEHSYQENIHNAQINAMVQTFESIVPNYRQPIAHRSERAVVDISPELAKVLNDLLTLPCKQIENKYGPLGDLMQIDFECADGLQGCISLLPSWNGSGASAVLSSTAEPELQIEIQSREGEKLHTEILPAGTKKQITGEYQISFQGTHITIAIQENENLRRTGNQFLFQTKSEEDAYTKHNGELCTIQRALTVKECDVLCTGLMWLASFPDGEELHVFDDELYLPLANKELKLSLDLQIETAQSRAQSQTESQPSNKPERT